MPTIPSRARRWIKSGKATAFFRKGLFCVRLNSDPSDYQRQEVAVGIDPGSKKEAFTMKSAAHTYVSVQTDAVTWVKDKVEARRNARRGRRFRKTPCRQNRMNRARGTLPPSTKARWGLKVRIATWLWSICPVSLFVVENVAARTRPGRNSWNSNFSPVQVGKRWFYSELGKLAHVVTQEGWETAEHRSLAGLPKISDKMSNNFFAHCVDSWVLANWGAGGTGPIENTHRVILKPWNPARRQLHVFQYAKGSLRKEYGSTRSLGFRRHSLVTHPKFGLTFVGGASKGYVSLNQLSDNHRLTQKAKPDSLVFKSYYSWNYFHIRNEI